MSLARCPFNLILLFVLAVSGGGGCAHAQVQPVYDLTRPITGQAGRVSSADPNWRHGSGDYRTLEAGGSLVLADLDSPGVINHIWLTMGDAQSQIWKGALRDLTLKFYWDNETTPSVEAPLGDFFALGNSQIAHLESAMVQVGGPVNRGFNCYWKMPFTRHARLEVHNKSLVNTMDKFYYQIDWVRLGDLPPDTMNFHARYREQTLSPGQGEYVLAEITGSGTMVGSVFSIRNPDGFGEADEHIFIDGEASPSISGTGSEDYVNQAWGFKSETSLYHGMLALPDGSWTLYRWHVPDPVTFRRSLKFSWENWGYNGVTFSEKTWDFSSVVYWYQTAHDAQTSRVHQEDWDPLE